MLELGYGLIRRFDPVTGDVRRLGAVDNKFERFAFGWAWLDVDRFETGPPHYPWLVAGDPRESRQPSIVR